MQEAAAHRSATGARGRQFTFGGGDSGRATLAAGAEEEAEAGAKKEADSASTKGHEDEEDDGNGETMGDETRTGD